MSSMEPLVLEQHEPIERGRAHGEQWRASIRELAEEQIGRTIARSREPRDGVLAAAEASWQRLHERWPEQAQELMGIAEGAEVSPAEIVVLNTFDAMAGPQITRPDEQGMAVYFNGERGPLLGLTWELPPGFDAHVRLLRIAPARSEREILCLTVAGCPGVAGINERGLTVATTALSVATTTAAGLPWPSVVRAALEQPNAEAARQQVVEATLSGGRFFMLADGDDYYGIEHSGTTAVLTQLGPRAAHLHTNHPFDPVLRRQERLWPEGTSHQRLNLITTLYAQQRPRDVDGLWSLLSARDDATRSAGAEPPAPGGPTELGTAATIAIRLHEGWMRVARGAPGLHSPIERSVESFAAVRPE